MRGYAGPDPARIRRAGTPVIVNVRAAAAVFSQFLKKETHVDVFIEPDG